MNTEAYGTTIFCDDIRFEASGKLTLVGCYTNEMNFSGSAPGKLPSFAALVNLRVPKEVEFKKIDLRVFKELVSGSEEIFHAEIEVTEEQREHVYARVGGQTDVEPIISMTIPLQWSPLEVSSEGFIKVRAYLDEVLEVRLGALKVNFAGEDTAKEHNDS